MNIENEANKYDKVQLYEAYCVENQERKRLNKELNDERRMSAGLLHDLRVYRKLYFREHILHNVPVIAGSNTVDDFFDTNWRIVETKHGGYYAYEIVSPKEIFIWYAWRDKNHWKEETKAMIDLILDLNDKYEIIQYVGQQDVMKRHSIHLGSELYQLDRESLMKYKTQKDT